LFLIVIFFIVFFFAIVLAVLCRKPISTVLFHVGGVLLILNSLDTYGFELLFPNCQASGMTNYCPSYGRFEGIVEALGCLQVLNLVFRFMMLIGFVLDGLALWYLLILAAFFLNKIPDKDVHIPFVRQKLEEEKQSDD
jgi:hypothetical protein